MKETVLLLITFYLFSVRNEGSTQESQQWPKRIRFRLKSSINCVTTALASSATNLSTIQDSRVAMHNCRGGSLMQFNSLCWFKSARIKFLHLNHSAFIWLCSLVSLDIFVPCRLVPSIRSWFCTLLVGWHGLMWSYGWRLIFYNALGRPVGRPSWLLFNDTKLISGSFLS